jgi:hypothetical protein
MIFKALASLRHLAACGDVVEKVSATSTARRAAILQFDNDTL